MRQQQVLESAGELRQELVDERGEHRGAFFLALPGVHKRRDLFDLGQTTLDVLVIHVGLWGSLEEILQQKTVPWLRRAAEEKRGITVRMSILAREGHIFARTNR